MALAFAILPLGRARDVPATALFREQGFERSRPAAPGLLSLRALCLARACRRLPIWSADDRRIVADLPRRHRLRLRRAARRRLLVQWLARRSPRVSSPALRLAIGNIHRPGALTPSVVLSLGLGLALLVTLALIDGNLRRQICRQPAGAGAELLLRRYPGQPRSTRFATLVAARGAGRQDDRRADAARPHHGVQRRGRAEDRTCRRRATGCCAATAASPMPKTMPENSTLPQAKWWPEDYSGEPLVSFSAEEAGELGLKIGDTVTVNVLGRNITARIANFRKVRMGIDVDQFRHGVLAQHLRRRAACLAGDADRPGRHAGGRGADPQRRDARLSRRSPACGSRMRSTSSTGSSPSSARRSAPPPASRWSPRFWCWPARLPPATGPASTMPSC